MRPADQHVDDKLLEYAYGELSDREAKAVEVHLRACPSCAESLSAMTQVRRTMSQLPIASPPAAGLESLLSYAKQAADSARAAPARRSPWLRWVAPIASVAALSVVLVISSKVARRTESVTALTPEQARGDWDRAPQLSAKAIQPSDETKAPPSRAEFARREVNGANRDAAAAAPLAEKRASQGEARKTSQAPVSRNEENEQLAQAAQQRAGKSETEQSLRQAKPGGPKVAGALAKKEPATGPWARPPEGWNKDGADRATALSTPHASAGPEFHPTGSEDEIAPDTQAPSAGAERGRQPPAVPSTGTGGRAGAQPVPPAGAGRASAQQDEQSGTRVARDRGVRQREEPSRARVARDLDARRDAPDADLSQQKVPSSANGVRAGVVGGIVGGYQSAEKQQGASASEPSAGAASPATGAPDAPARRPPPPNTAEREREVARLRQAIAGGAQGHERARLLRRLCDELDALGRPREADAACDAVIREFPTSDEARSAAQRRQARPGN